MKELTCMIVGGGFAGIHAVKAIRKAHKANGAPYKLNLILFDQQRSHLRKVLLFRPAVSEQNITIPWQQVLQDDAVFIQGSALEVDGVHKKLLYRDSEGQTKEHSYDVLVMAIGSIARQPDPNQGGIPLTGVDAAARILELWQSNMKRAAIENKKEERQRLLTAAVAGAGISGVETAAELAYAMRNEASANGLDPSEVKVHLINAQERLFLEGPVKVSLKLDQDLAECGVIVHHNRRAIREEEGRLQLSEGDSLPVGLTVWTLGLVPNPALQTMGLPVTEQGQVIVDESYRVRGRSGVYAIGDNAFIVEQASGKACQMTCKEAIPQAQRLGKIIVADLTGSEAPKHKAVMDAFTIGLGPGRGIMWTRKWGLDIIISDKLAYKIKCFAWDYASMLKS
ncbi:NADH dehydrogenase [Paenibacillus catalpae]|uniref:NADH:ubiquinone reductase (non-electrogenic) n=1 Tax=Paenibacillus catalpae TaxID=1045775 RepID=A0A1I2BKJ5_9BACL|nr:FAD-dependent oxidoreductase [Paenibacillus catalpae]SFE56696.1 NADH dehydrogenase [Paenibacillus catalpae]